MAQPPSRTRFYLDKRNKKIMGVCAGIANYTGLDVNLVRIGLVLSVFIGAGALIPVYFIAGWIASDEPREIYVAVPLTEAIAMIALPTIFTNVWQAAVGGNFRRIVRRQWPLIVPLVIYHG